MPRPKGSQNKISTEVKEQLQSLIDQVVNSIDVNSIECRSKTKTFTAIPSLCTA